MFLKDCGVQHDVVASFFSELTTGLEERALGAKSRGLWMNITRPILA